MWLCLEIYYWPLAASSVSTREDAIRRLVTLYDSSVQIAGKSVRSWCDGSSDRSFMG